jgi:hypothetical protein
MIRAALWFAIFCVTIAVDFAWSKYMLEAAAKRPHHAAAWAVAILLLGSISVLVYIGDRWTLLPMAAGSYVGTYWAVKRAKKEA